MPFGKFKARSVVPLAVLLTACGAQGATAPGVTSSSRSVATSTLVVPAATATIIPTIVPATPVPSATAQTSSDLPDLLSSPASVSPTSAPLPAHVKLARPARIIIPDIALDLETTAVGLDRQQVPIVPKHEPGWFSGSAVPGAGTNVVVWGHVLRWQDAPEVPAPFARLEELRPGARLSVVTADGRSWDYRVTQQLRVRPRDVHFIAPTLTERVTLVSCIGDKVIQDGALTKEFRLVTVAEPVR